MKKEKPLILITNDDGVHAPGIKHLWNAIHPFADVYVVAPATEQSAVGLSITIRHPLRIEKVEWPSNAEHIVSVNGTPADCVKLALHAVLPRRPQLILSGINRGSNAGRNMLYSGTVAAIIEGTLHGIPGIALSYYDFFKPQYQQVEKFIPPLVEYVLENALPKGTFLNVNFPHTADGKIKGIRLTRQGQEYLAENPELRHHPAENNPYYWLGTKMLEFDEHEDSDIAWLRQGYAAAVPIHIGELTHHEHLEKQKSHFHHHVNQLNL